MKHSKICNLLIWVNYDYMYINVRISYAFLQLQAGMYSLEASLSASFMAEWRL